MHHRTFPASVAALLLAACTGSKISTDLPEDTGATDGGSADGGAADGGGDGGDPGDGGGGDGGSTEVDADGDGWTVGNGDCNDGDDTVYPTAADECYDGVDSNCNEDDDYDCDGDGYASDEHGGTDCDDADDAIHPGAGDGSPDGIDQDCDGEPDEDVCNVYAMLGVTAGSRVYETLFFDGSSYSELVEHADFDSAAGTATVVRSLTGGKLDMTLEERWACAEDGTVTVSGYTASSLGFAVGDATFSTPAVRLLPQGDMTTGASWTLDYTASDPTLGDLWTVQATLEVTGTQDLTVAAGTFETVTVHATYTITDLSTWVGDRAGEIVYSYAPGVGLVYSLDTLSDGTVSEERELYSFDGFTPLPLADVE